MHILSLHTLRALQIYNNITCIFNVQLLYLCKTPSIRSTLQKSSSYLILDYLIANKFDENFTIKILNICNISLILLTKNLKLLHIEYTLAVKAYTTITLIFNEIKYQ